MEKSQSIKNIAKALMQFHSTVGGIKKDSQNPFFKSSYASLSTILDAIKDPLATAGLSFSQLPDGETLITVLMHIESGEYLQSVYPLPVVKANDPQALGSSITYARRYALSAILGLNVDEDDDGNAASKLVKPVAKKQETVVHQQKPVAAPVTQQAQPVAATPIKPAIDEERCPKCNGGMWDCRTREDGGKGQYPKTNPAAPDWKCKDKQCGGATWLRDDRPWTQPDKFDNEPEITVDDIPS